jgi:7-cyano-7-deazaguanine synthase
MPGAQPLQAAQPSQSSQPSRYDPGVPLNDPIAVVLLSGGLDSAAALAIARSHGSACYALSVDYGQRHRHELSAASAVAKQLGAREHKTVRLDLRTIGGSALTADIPVPKNRQLAAGEADIPITYVPARNLVFLSIATAWAEVLGARDVYIGVNAVDYSGYPDCRPEFIRAFEAAASLATRAGVDGTPCRIRTPLIELSKAEIIREGARLGVDFSLTHSCYDPIEAPSGVLACGRCDSCTLRVRGFREAGIPDPTRYVA